MVARLLVVESDSRNADEASESNYVLVAKLITSSKAVSVQRVAGSKALEAALVCAPDAVDRKSLIASVARPDDRGTCGGTTITTPAQARRRGVWQPHPRHSEDDETDESFLAVRL